MRSRVECAVTGRCLTVEFHQLLVISSSCDVGFLVIVKVLIGIVRCVGQFFVDIGFFRLADEVAKSIAR